MKPDYTRKDVHEEVVLYSTNGHGLFKLDDGEEIPYTEFMHILTTKLNENDNICVRVEEGFYDFSGITLYAYHTRPENDEEYALRIQREEKEYHKNSTRRKNTMLRKKADEIALLRKLITKYKGKIDGI